MKQIFLTVGSMFLLCGLAIAGEKQETRIIETFDSQNRKRAEFILQLQQNELLSTVEGMAFKEELVMGKKKSAAKAVLFSALIPGSGQLYGGSLLKGVAFLVVEAATLAGYVHFQGRGNDLETEFEQFADQNWVEDVYWSWMYDECQADPGYSGSCVDVSGDASLRDYEEWRSDFSHFLPEEKNQTYYENIGKYDQFNIGWIDTNTGQGEDSDLREEYTLIRRDANDNFKRATNMVTITLFNHVLSAVDAGLSIKRHNEKIAEARLNMQGVRYNDEVIPTLNLTVMW